MKEENRKGAPEEPGAFQKVLGALNQGQKIRALEIARKHGIPDDDPVWHVVLTIAEAEEGIKEVSRSLREASVSVTEASAAVVKENRERAALEIQKMQEAAKGNIAKALGETLETEIGKAVGRLQSQNNRPLHKNWLIAMVVVILLAVGGAGWGFWSFYTYAKNVGEAQISLAISPSNDFYHFMKCDKAGWEKKWVEVGGKKYLACYPSSTAGEQGWIIAP